MNTMQESPPAEDITVTDGMINAGAGELSRLAREHGIRRLDYHRGTIAEVYRVMERARRAEAAGNHNITPPVGTLKATGQ
jgi:hypothetical protein